MSVLYKRFLPDRYETAYIVNDKQSGMRLDQFLLLYMTSFSREQVKQKIKDGDVNIQNREGTHRPNTKVYEKEVVEFCIRKTIHEDEWWNGEKLELDEPEILYEDDNLYVLSKPAYMATHPTGKHLFNCATVYLESICGHNVHSIHRLDRETSGILLIGKNPKASSQMTICFEKEQVKKCYFFIAIKNDDYKGETSFEANERLETGGEGLRRVYIDHYPENSDQGKRARTLFKILKTEGDTVIGLAFPQTGRQHQIRVHAMAHGLPLLGDKLYLGSYEMFQRFKDRYATPEDHELMQIPRQALHAIALNLPYPEKRKTFLSYIPKDLSEWISKNTKINLDDLHEQIKLEVENYFNLL